MDITLYVCYAETFDDVNDLVLLFPYLGSVACML